MRERMVTKAMTRLQTILVRTPPYGCLGGPRVAQRGGGVDERESIDGAEPTAERPAGVGAQPWGEEKGDDVETLEMSTRPATMWPTCCGAVGPGAAGADRSDRGRRRCCDRARRDARGASLAGLVAAGQPLGTGGQRFSQRERHGDLRRPRARRRRPPGARHRGLHRPCCRRAVDGAATGTRTRRKASRCSHPAAADHRVRREWGSAVAGQQPTKW